MRLVMKMSYDKKFMTRDVTTEQIAVLLDIVNGGVFITEKYNSATGEYENTVDGSKELEIEILPQNSRRIPELPLRQHVLETVIREATDETAT